MSKKKKRLPSWKRYTYVILRENNHRLTIRRRRRDTDKQLGKFHWHPEQLKKKELHSLSWIPRSEMQIPIVRGLVKELRGCRSRGERKDAVRSGLRKLAEKFGLDYRRDGSVIHWLISGTDHIVFVWQLQLGDYEESRARKELRHDPAPYRLALDITESNLVKIIALPRAGIKWNEK